MAEYVPSQQAIAFRRRLGEYLGIDLDGFTIGEVTWMGDEEDGYVELTARVPGRLLRQMFEERP